MSSEGQRRGQTQSEKDHKNRSYFEKNNDFLGVVKPATDKLMEK